MKILFIVSRPLEINSSASLRNINTVNGLCDMGHEVTVVTGYPEKQHPLYTPIELRPSTKLLYTKTNTVKNLSAQFSRSKLLRKARNLVYKYHSRHNIYDSWKYVLNDEIWDELKGNYYDILISSADPKSSHLAAEAFLNKHKIPWIQIWGDPFTGDITNINSRNEDLRRSEEIRLISKADKVVYLSELTADEMKEKYPEYTSKISFMPRPYVKENKFEVRDYYNKKINLAYCGDYNSTIRNILPLYNAVRTTGDNLTICGNSDVELDNSLEIKVLGRVPLDKVFEIESNADVLIHVSNLSGTQIPGKIYNYSATNKPIIFILDGESKKIKSAFEKYNRYLFCENTESDITKALEIVRTNKYPASLDPVVDFYYKIVLKRLLDL